MAAEAKRGDALQLIFSIFLGVLLVVVVGVGVWTFYPSPDSENSAQQQQIQKLYREQEQYNIKAGSGMTPAEEAEYKRLQAKIDTLQDKITGERKNWAVTTSIIVLSIATVLMAVSLFLPEIARVFSNGILLGGLFTVLYGTGVSFTGGDSRARFYVVLVALVLSFAFGYLRFIRGRMAEAAAALVTVSAATPDGAATDTAEVAGLEARVAELERRAVLAAAAFGSPPEDR